jgi:heterodisulfide reductase subunit B
MAKLALINLNNGFPSYELKPIIEKRVKKSLKGFKCLFMYGERFERPVSEITLFDLDNVTEVSSQEILQKLNEILGVEN